MVRPATTRITSPYGESPGYDGFHNGIDFAHDDPSDTPVFAFRAGVVVYVGWYPGWAGRGFVVIIDHGNGAVSWSCHLRSASVTVGQQLTEGQRIGTMGATGTTAVHLHWMLYVNGVVVDPTPYLTGTAGNIEEDDMYDAAAEKRLMEFINDQARPRLYRNPGTGEIAAIRVDTGYVRVLKSVDDMLTLIWLDVIASTATVYEVSSETMDGLKGEAAQARAAFNGAGAAVPAGSISDEDLRRIGLTVDTVLADDFAAVPTAEQNGAAARAAIVK